MEENRPQQSNDVTALLRRWGAGEGGAAGELVETTYDELRAIAGGYLRRESRHHTLQATGLVNELYLRLARQHSPQFTDRRHFYSFAAMVMRRILIDHARRSRSHGGEGGRMPLHPEMAWIDSTGEEMLTLDAALTELEALDERKARTIELRYFLGCTNEEVAEILSVSRVTVDRDLQFSKSWLHRRFRAGEELTRPANV